MKRSKNILRILALLLCLFTLLSTVSCGISFDDLGKNKETDSETDTESETEDGTTVDEGIFAPVIKKYKELVALKLSGGEMPTAENDNSPLAAIINTIELCSETAELGYAIKDINRDGHNELLLMRKNGTLFALLTEKDGMPRVAEIFKGTAFIVSYERICIYEKDENKRIAHKIMCLSDGELVGLEYGTRYDEETLEVISHYKIENGVESEISSEDMANYNRIYDGYYTGSLSHTKRFGLFFISAVDAEPSDAPYVDFSSYEAIIDTYRAICEIFEHYKSSAWAFGELDGYFNYRSAEDYYIFNDLLRSGASYSMQFNNVVDISKEIKNAYGYAKKDINGDGVDELLLMRDSYEIMAMFTVIDGKTVYLNSLMENVPNAIDVNGYLYVSKDIGSGSYFEEYRNFVYELTPNGIRMRVGVSVDASGSYRIGDNGENISIPVEEYNELARQTRIDLPGFCSRNEYLKSFLGIDFVPFYDVEAKPQEFAGIWRNYHMIGRNELEITKEGRFIFNYVTPYDETKELLYDEDLYKKTFTAAIRKENGQYVFDNGEITGVIEFGLYKIWLTVTETTDPYVQCRDYCFDYQKS